MKCKLEDIVDVTMGQSPKSEYYNTEGKGYPFLQGNRTFGFKYPTFDTYTTVMTKPAKAGDVIMSVRAPVGDLNITPVNSCLWHYFSLFFHLCNMQLLQSFPEQQ